jgi:hypothetical protein
MRPTDLLRRSTPTPFADDLCVMGHLVHLETNSRVALEHLRDAFGGDGEPDAGQPDFVWKLIVEPDAGPERDPVAAFSVAGLSLVTVGQYTFMAVDLRAREAIVFLEERFTKDRSEFERLVAATLLKLTAPALQASRPRTDL